MDLFRVKKFFRVGGARLRVQFKARTISRVKKLRAYFFKVNFFVLGCNSYLGNYIFTLNKFLFKGHIQKNTLNNVFYLRGIYLSV